MGRADGYESADAIVAVSAGMRNDVLDAYPNVNPHRVHVIHNGIDTSLYRPDTSTEVLVNQVSTRTGRTCSTSAVTRQKGLPHLLRAATRLDKGVQLVLAASAPDTPEIGAEVAAAIDELRADRGGDVVWLDTMLPRDDVIALLSHATAFCCRWMYEPLGIVNLEAMACQTAVIASDVGGIPEVVDDGKTGLLVHYSRTTRPGTRWRWRRR